MSFGHLISRLKCPHVWYLTVLMYWIFSGSCPNNDIEVEVTCIDCSSENALILNNQTWLDYHHGSENVTVDLRGANDAVFKNLTLAYTGGENAEVNMTASGVNNGQPRTIQVR